MNGRVELEHAHRVGGADRIVDRLLKRHDRWFTDLSEAIQSRDRAVKTFLQPKNEQ